MATWIGSPNYTEGRQGETIDRVVIHWADGTLASTDQVFQDVVRQTSSHYGIENSTIHQYVKETDTAYHAGVWSMNLRSIGIEHSASPDRPATASTIDTSAKLVADICKRYNIPCDRKHVIKHSEVPYATACPGTIPIDQIVSKANLILKGNDMAKVDLFTARRIAYGILGDHTALTGKRDADLKKNHVGRELTPQYIQTLFDSKEAVSNRAAADKLVQPGAAEKQLAAVKATLGVK